MLVSYRVALVDCRMHGVLLHPLPLISFEPLCTTTGAWNQEKRQQRAARMAGHGGGGHGRAFKAAAAAAEEAAAAAVETEAKTMQTEPEPEEASPEPEEASPEPDEARRSPSGLMNSTEWDSFWNVVNQRAATAPSTGASIEASCDESGRAVAAKHALPLKKRARESEFEERRVLGNKTNRDHLLDPQLLDDKRLSIDL